MNFIIVFLNISILLRFNFKTPVVNGVTDHPNAASVEAMDTSDASNPISSSSSRFTVKPATNNKQQLNKPMSPGRILLSYLINNIYIYIFPQKDRCFI